MIFLPILELTLWLSFVLILIYQSRFWVTVCKTVRPMLSDRCLSVLSVCDVCALWPVRFEK